jgi:hypothetical protein
VLNRHHPADAKPVFKHSEFGRPNVFSRGIVTLPPSASALKTLSAFCSSGTIIESEKPSKHGSPSHLPSEAIRIVSPIRKLACITLFSIPGCVMPGSGASLKRLSISTSAPTALR